MQILTKCVHNNNLYRGNFFPKSGFPKGPRRFRPKKIHKIKRKKGIIAENYINKLKHVA